MAQQKEHDLPFACLAFGFCQVVDLLCWWILLTSEPVFPGLHCWLRTSSSQESSRFWVPDWDCWGIQHGLSNCWNLSLCSVKQPPRDSPSFEDSESMRFLASQVQDHCHYYFTICWFNTFLHACVCIHTSCQFSFKEPRLTQMVALGNRRADTSYGTERHPFFLLPDEPAQSNCRIWIIRCWQLDLYSLNCRALQKSSVVMRSILKFGILESFNYRWTLGLI